MDQDKAQQSIDTLSEKVNGVVRSVRVSCSPENDYRGETRLSFCIRRTGNRMFVCGYGSIE